MKYSVLDVIMLIMQRISNAIPEEPVIFINQVCTHAV